MLFKNIPKEYPTGDFIMGSLQAGPELEYLVNPTQDYLDLVSDRLSKKTQYNPNQVHLFYSLEEKAAYAIIGFTGGSLWYNIINDPDEFDIYFPGDNRQ